MIVWSATPLFVNNTVYLGTPFYRILALEPDSGKVKWTFNPHATLKALTQPDLKNRGVAYWQAEDPQSGKACEKIVYIGTMDAKLYGVDADTGKPCPNFGKNGMVDVNQWNTVNDKWPLSLLQPPTVYHDMLFLGWAGKDWTDTAAPPGAVFALDARTGASNGRSTPSRPRRPPRPERRMSGPPCRSTRRTDLLYIPVSSPSPNFYGGKRKEKLPARDIGHRARLGNGKSRLEPAARSSRHLGLRHQFRAGPDRHQEGRQRRSPLWCSPQSRDSSLC